MKFRGCAKIRGAKIKGAKIKGARKFKGIRYFEVRNLEFLGFWDFWDFFFFFFWRGGGAFFRIFGKLRDFLGP